MKDLNPADVERLTRALETIMSTVTEERKSALQERQNADRDRQKIDQVLLILQGDGTQQNPGILLRLSLTERTLEEISNDMREWGKLKWRFAAALLGSGGVGAGVMKLLEVLGGG